MLSRRLLGVVLVGGLSLVGTGIAAAQGGPAPADASAGVGRTVTMSPQEEVQQAEGFVSRMDATRSTVRRQLETARQQRDVVKVLCLNDKLTQIDVAIRAAKDRKTDLENAARQGDSDRASHEFTILTVLRQRTDQLTAEANQCIGEEGVSIEEAAVNVTVEDVPKEDPSEYPVNNIVIEVPSCSSCFK